jgi:hypothetical protein
MSGMGRAIALSAMLFTALSVPQNDAVGQAGELEVTLRVLDDATGVVAARITIPPEPSKREAVEPPQAANPPAEEARSSPAAESRDAAPPAASASQ